jgi:L-iditol 2-dehydrogenase
MFYMMKAVVKTARRSGCVELQELPVPQPQTGEVRIRVKAASICGSDIHAYHYDPSYSFISVPVILGHEFSGVVDAVHPSVTEFTPGDRVVVEAIHYCGRCRSCASGDKHICEHFQVIGLHKNGGFAEYVCVPEPFIHKLPEEVEIETASVVEPLSVAVHAVRNQMHTTAGEVIAVFGPGPIGLFAAQVIKSVGATPVLFGIDSDEKARLPLGREWGIATVNLSKVPADRILAELGVDRFDQVIDCSGSPQAVELGLELLKKGGKMTLVGLFKDRSTIDYSKIVRNEIMLIGSYSSTSENYREAIELLMRGTVQTDKMLSHYRLTEHDQAFQDAIAKRIIKPVLHI